MSIPVVNVKDAPYGAAGDGSTDDSAAILAAIADAAGPSGPGIVYFPPGVYKITRSGSSSYCIDLNADNITLLGAKGRSVIQAASGMPNASVSLFRVDSHENVVFRDLVIDGNWGAEVGVTTTNAGINHATQTDPKNHGIMVRGSSNVTVENCKFQQIYGDAIWLGHRADDNFTIDYWAENIQILGCRFDLCARNGITLGAAQRKVTIERCTMTNIYTSGIDSEPQSLWGHSRDVVIRDCDLAGWWDPANGGSMNNIISCVGGVQSGRNERSAARGWRIVDNRLHGSTYMATAIDVVMRGNRIVMAPNGETGGFRAPIFIDHSADNITIEDNYIYDNAPAGTFSSHVHNGAIHVQHYSADASRTAQPAGVAVRNNRIHVRNGVHGIFINGVGGFAYSDTHPVQPPTSGTATGVTSSTLTHTGAGWTAGRWVGWTVIIDGRVGLVAANTSDTLTLALPTLSTLGWFTPAGELSTTPSAGTYWITNTSGVCDIDGNEIDCGYDGNTAGGDGIYLLNDYAGGRLRVHNNKIKNCGASTSGGLGRWGIYVSGDTSDPILSLEITDNKFWDDQPVASMSGGIRFPNTPSLTSIPRLVMNGNMLLGGVSTLLSGVSTGRWLLRDGSMPDWTGYGSPESVVTAPIGATYRRIDGGATTTLYVKESGTGNTGWVAK